MLFVPGMGTEIRSSGDGRPRSKMSVSSGLHNQAGLPWVPCPALHVLKIFVLRPQQVRVARVNPLLSAGFRDPNGMRLLSTPKTCHGVSATLPHKSSRLYCAAPCAPNHTCVHLFRVVCASSISQSMSLAGALSPTTISLSIRRANVKVPATSLSA